MTINLTKWTRFKALGHSGVHVAFTIVLVMVELVGRDNLIMGEVFWLRHFVPVRAAMIVT